MTLARFQNVTAIAYVFGMYGLGIALILQLAWIMNILGMIAIAHSLIISTALVHEFIHGNICQVREWNVFWGKVMTHFNGACYAPWENIVEHHFNHHLHHVDIVRFDVAKYLSQEIHPGLRWIYVVLEWLYFPLLEFEMRWRIIGDGFVDPDRRDLLGRTLGLMMLRVLAFGLLAWVSWKALLLYFVAYVSFVNVMRFMDAFHHSYQYTIAGEDFPQLNRVYEQANTFSNLVSVKYPVLNLLFLNFGYHNAHHHQMSCPWHELPALHQKLYGEIVGGASALPNRGLLPLSQLMGNYHRFRLKRLFAGQGEINADKEGDLADFVGGVAVSLLTPP
jgi:fatty acid desaturase